MGNFDDDEIYPNQPLEDVACEIRFRGEMQVECERHLFWDAIRHEYPDILVPNISPGEAPALRHYRFRSQDKGRIVQVALNSLAYSEPSYRGHKAFIDEFDRLSGIFKRTYPKISQITRIGWRYTNVMPFVRESGLVPLNRMTNLEISLPDKLFGNSSSLDLKWKGRCMDGELLLRVAVVNRKDAPKQEALLLDIDFGQDRSDMKWEDARSVVEDGRRKCRSIFEGLITDGYRDYLRGDGL